MISYFSRLTKITLHTRVDHIVFLSIDQHQHSFEYTFESENFLERWLEAR